MELGIRARRLRGLVHRAGASVRRIFPLGIIARLAISFIAVAVLAATSNLIAQESVSVILWSTQPRRADNLVRTQNAPPFTIEKRKTAALASVVDRFELASQLRAETNSSTIDAEYTAAQDALRRTSNDYLAMGPANTGLDHTVADYINHGRQIVHVADQRRLARAEHFKLLETINGRLQATLAGSWKIFGRVIARQSLIQLHVELDAVRQHSERMVLGEAIDANELQALTDSEHAFVTTFANNATSFASAQGADWVQRTRADFDELVALRGSLAALNSRYDDAIRRFSQDHVSVFVAISAAPSLAPAPPVQPDDRQYAFSAPLPSFQVSALPTPDDVLTETAIKHSDHHSRNLMALVTAIVLLIVTAISALTVRSVVRPVRRILRGAGALAVGNTQVQIARGGIRELDTLADAFNDMASRIALAQAASRTHEETLEKTVLERTHMLQALAQQDPLTSLPNRRHLSALLNNAIERATREKRYLGVYFLD